MEVTEKPITLVSISIENIVTHPDYRKRGIGTRVIQYALGIAWEHRYSKVMLLTGSKNEATLRFYERAGFVRGEKTGFVARANPERDQTGLVETSQHTSIHDPLLMIHYS